jgi:hypothetical protein
MNTTPHPIPHPIPQLQESLDAIATFVTSEPFLRVMREFADVPRAQRHDFVRRVLINRDAMAQRGVQVPQDLIIQRTAFEDRRPTIFAVVKHLPEPGKKVTVTFDEGWEAELLDYEFGEEQLLEAH